MRWTPIFSPVLGRDLSGAVGGGGRLQDVRDGVKKVRHQCWSDVDDLCPCVCPTLILSDRVSRCAARPTLLLPRRPPSPHSPPPLLCSSRLQLTLTLVWLTLTSSWFSRRSHGPYLPLGEGEDCLNLGLENEHGEWSRCLSTGFFAINIFVET